MEAVDEGYMDITVRLHADGVTEISLTQTEHPAQVLREAAGALERYAASIEAEPQPVTCKTCGAAATGVRAAPGGQLQLVPCGHGVPKTE